MLFLGFARCPLHGFGACDEYHRLQRVMLLQHGAPGRASDESDRAFLRNLSLCPRYQGQARSSFTAGLDRSSPLRSGKPVGRQRRTGRAESTGR